MCNKRDVHLWIATEGHQMSADNSESQWLACNSKNAVFQEKAGDREKEGGGEEVHRQEFKRLLRAFVSVSLGSLWF